MATFSGLTMNISGIKSLAASGCCSKLLFHNRYHDVCRFTKFHYGSAIALRKNPNVRISYFHHRTGRILSTGRNYQLDYSDNSHTEPEPFWLNLIRVVVWITRSLLLFLAEQPSQLKYIEWPSFQSTLKTATLTLVLVALLIVALSSIDSALSYLLALYLRRKA